MFSKARLHLIYRLRKHKFKQEDLMYIRQEKMRETESRDDGWDMWISQKLFLDRKSVSRDVRDYLGWRHMNLSGIVRRFLESHSSSIKSLDLLESIESISNSRIWGKINQSPCFWNRFRRTNGYSTRNAILNSPPLRTSRKPGSRFRDIQK